MDKKKKIRNDIFLITIVLIVSVLSLWAFFAFSSKGDSVKVSVNGETVCVLWLDSDTKKTFKTKYGTNTVVVKNKKVFVTNADCPDKLCENHREISHPGETIICLPHKFSVTVTCEKTDKNPDITV